jgi:hypothetical protein
MKTRTPMLMGTLLMLSAFAQSQAREPSPICLASEAPQKKPVETQPVSEDKGVKDPPSRETRRPQRLGCDSYNCVASV